MAKGKRVLFIDNQEIRSMHGVERVIHPAQKYEDNPVVISDKPWEKDLITGTVRRENGIYRMWYQSYIQKTYLNLYAESEDGVKWIKPALGQYEDFEGKTDNNIFLSRLALRHKERTPLDCNQDNNPNVLYTPHLGRGREYTLISYDYGRSGYSAYDGYFLAFSRDGLKWTDGPEEPVIPGHADVGWFLFDEAENMFRGIVKTFLNTGGVNDRRSVLWTESKDGLDWTLPRPAVLPEPEDERWAKNRSGHTEFYGMPIFRYESVILGFLQIFRVTGIVAKDTQGEIDVQLVCSRDGRHWSRVGNKQPILGLGKTGAWDSGMVLTGNSLVAEDDMVRIYYTGTNGKHADAYSMSLGVASWPRDRFVGLRVRDEEGEVRIIQTVEGPELHINADASNGFLLAEILTEENKPIKGFELENCIPTKEDVLDHVICWQKGASLGSLLGKTITIRLKLVRAEIFSLW